MALRERYARDDHKCFCESFKLKVRQAFIDFWDDDVVIPSVRIFHRRPSFKEKPLTVIWLMYDDLNIVKVHLIMPLADMALVFGILVETQYNLFVLRYSGLEWSFCLAIVYKIALSAIDFEHNSRGWTVRFILLLLTWENAVDGFLRLAPICCCYKK